MSTLPQVFVDAEGAVRSWARSEAGIVAVASTRTFFGIPENYGGAWPILVCQRVGGAPDPNIAPIDRALIQFDCWGSPDKTLGRKAQAASLAAAVVTAARSLQPKTAMGLTAVSFGAEVELGPVWSPDPATDQARYVVDVAFYLRAA